MKDKAALLTDLAAKDFVRNVATAVLIQQRIGAGDDAQMADALDGYEYWCAMISEVNKEETVMRRRRQHFYVETATRKAFYAESLPTATIQPPPVVAAVEEPVEDPILEL